MGDTMTEIDYELFAIRYATRDARRAAHFIGGDPHDGPMPMDYFVWVAKGGGRTFVIDTGFNAEVSEKRQRTFLRCPVEALATLGIDANAVEDVILTHLHYDHVGNFDRFPKARFHLQERENAQISICSDLAIKTRSVRNLHQDRPVLVVSAP
jgi:glyoxylase-like metal-dependent hydrolase (beta-lactamase superfamily II)